MLRYSEDTFTQYTHNVILTFLQRRPNVMDVV